MKLMVKSSALVSVIDKIAFLPYRVICGIGALVTERFCPSRWASQA